jgi:hypothetical protein
MAVVQIGVIVVASRLARRVEHLADQVDREIKPLFVHLDAIGRDASRVAGLAVAQVERADRVLDDATERLEDGLQVVQSILAAPAREGRALISGLRALLEALQNPQSEAHRSPDDEDALFI